MTDRAESRAERHRIEFLDALRAVAMLLVVGVHARGYVLLQDPAEQWVTFVVTTISVPTFFLCDGYLLSLESAAAGPYRSHADYVARSARRLLVPWAIFSVLYTLARGLFEAGGLLPDHVVYGQPVGSILLRIYGSAIAPQMYFLLSLFAIRCAAPLWRWLAAAPLAVLVAVFVLYTVAFRCSAPALREIFSIPLDPIRHAFWGLQFYLAGACLARLRSALAPRYGHLAAASGLVLAAALTFDWALPWLLQYAYLLATFFFFAALSRTPRLLAAVGRDTMGIYLLHAPVLLKACSLVILAALPTSLLSYTLLTLAVFSIAWAITRALERAPYGSVLFGAFPARRTP